MIDEQGAPALPWLAPALRSALAAQRGHALLVHGEQGAGQWPFALALARAWLCEAAPAERPVGLACGRCAGCRMLLARAHPDLFVQLTEAHRRTAGWPLGDDRPDDEGKRKPSRQIRIDEVRAAIDWAGKTAARGRGKVWLLHPVEALNEHSASALLKTLEEPPAGTRLVLTCSDPLAILPTVRSRCQRLALPAPSAAEADGWLQAQGVAGASVLLAACSGRPLDARALAREGVDAAAWERLPAALVAGRPGALAGWPMPRALDALAKLAHDALARSAGAPTRYFAAGAVPAGCDPRRLALWVRELQRLAHHAEHPWHEGLAIDALAARARLALLPT